MVSGTALGTVAFLWLGIAANAADADTSAAFPRAPFLVNDNGTIASSASVSPCVTEEEACESSSKCLACFSAIGSDDDTAGDDGSGDDGSVNDATCEFIDALACEFYGADASCAANDEYEATVECMLEQIFVDCMVELCGSAMGFARYSFAAVFMPAAAAGLLVATLGTAL